MFVYATIFKKFYKPIVSLLDCSSSNSMDDFPCFLENSINISSNFLILFYPICPSLSCLSGDLLCLAFRHKALMYFCLSFYRDNVCIRFYIDSIFSSSFSFFYMLSLYSLSLFIRRFLFVKKVNSDLRARYLLIRFLLYS